ncbi:MAG TPA: hypothetical protein EYN66_14055 [Myxococcales bacterium]|nr:hypothetical protein [Myxococcales bacterium]
MGGSSTGGGTDGAGSSGDGSTDGGILNESDLDDLKTKSPKKKRTEFPETLYVNPSLITDGNGKAEVILPMADVITEWRVSMIANTANGRVGGGQGGITVFQDFFVDTDLPRKLTQNDLIELPIGVFNFSDKVQEVTVTVTQASWFSLTGSNQKSVAVEAGQSVQVPFTVKVLKAGHHNLEIDASTSSFSDGVIRTVQVMPDGQKYEWSKSGPLEGNLNQKVVFPELAIEGGNDAVLKIMGGSSAQMVDGIEALLRAPRGCFEPMMNSTWINALVLDYMVWTQTDNEALSATTKGHLDDGVQQCVTFECTGGGFTWFGDPDAAHPILSSFALIMMNDIVKVRDVDESMLKRTQDFLVNKQDFTGAWFTTEGTKNQVVPWDQLRTTCIATWGLASSQYEGGNTLAKAVTYINDAMEKDVDTYTLAMCANALLNAAPGDPNTDSVIAELMDRAVTEGDLTHWGSVDPGFTLAHGEVIDVETTALTAQALFKMEQPPLSLTDGALRYLSSKKSPNGNFMSTQGTIQSLRAFVAAAKYASGTTDAQVTVKVGDKTVFTTQIDDSNREVVHMVSLSEFSNQSELPVSIEYQGKGKLYWHLASEHYIKWNAEARRAGPLMDIDVTYSKLKMVVGESTMANISIVTNGDGAEPGDMPMVDVGIPPGFDADLSVLDELVANDPMVPRYEVKADRIVIYLHDLPAKSGAAFSFKLPLSPRYPMVVTTPSARAWPFYKPEQTSESLPVVLTVN